MSDIERQKDRAEIASEEGFTGTFWAFIEWLEAALGYGGIRHEKVLDRFERPVIKVETVTGGYSSDEHLLGRVDCSVLVRSNWRSSHAGGLRVYEFPMWLVDSTEEHVWLEPENGVFERLYRARRIRIERENGDHVELDFETGVELVFLEPDRDIHEPDGLVIVRPLEPIEF